MQQKIRILIVDDQRLMREGLRTILDNTPDVEIVGEADNGLIALQIAEQQHPDVILMDIRMPVLDGIEATERLLKQEGARPHILLLTTFDTPDLVIEGMRAGAVGYLLKDCSAEELCTAVRAVARGQVYLQAASAVQLLASLHPKKPETALDASPSSQAEKLGLTARELEVVQLITRGYNNTEIAVKLIVSDATVKTHINHIFSKLGVRDRSQVIIKAHQLGLA